MKCQIIEITGWTEQQYYAENSAAFITQFSTYLEGKAKGLDRKAKREANRRK